MSQAGKEIHQEIADWVGDIVALESHIEEAMDAQLKLESSDPHLITTIKHLHDSVRESKQRAVNFQKDHGSEAGNPVIKGGANLLGKAAGVIDKMRHDSVSKALRDDYTAYSHVTIAYAMLHTTAMAFADKAAQEFAEAGIRTYSGLVMDVFKAVPEAVVADLKSGDHAPVMDSHVIETCRARLEEIFREAAKQSA